MSYHSFVYTGPAVPFYGGKPTPLHRRPGMTWHHNRSPKNCQWKKHVIFSYKTLSQLYNGLGRKSLHWHLVSILGSSKAGYGILYLVFSFIWNVLNVFQVASRWKYRFQLISSHDHHSKIRPKGMGLTSSKTKSLIAHYCIIIPYHYSARRLLCHDFILKATQYQGQGQGQSSRSKFNVKGLFKIDPHLPPKGC